MMKVSNSSLGFRCALHISTCAAAAVATRLIPIGVLALLSSCAMNSKKPIHELIPDGRAGTVLMADVSILRDSVGTGSDYFVIEESEAGARAALGQLRKFMEPTGLNIQGDIASVCATEVQAGADQAIPVADRLQASIRQARRPAKVTGCAGSDEQAARAIRIVGTYAFERAAGNKNAKPGQRLVSMEEFEGAAKVIRDRTKASNLVYVGAHGTSLSAGKQVGSTLGRLAVGVGTGVLTAGMGTGYAVAFIPGGKTNGTIIRGAIIDLRTGSVAWSSMAIQSGNPVKEGKICNRAAMDQLFASVAFEPQSPEQPASGHPLP